MDNAVDSLRKLHTALIDTERGYQEALKDAGDPAVAALFTAMIELRRKDHAELHQALTRLGDTPDESGSFMAAVHRTVVDVRARLTGLNESALGSFVSGEESVIGLYDSALEAAVGDPDLRDLLNRQKAALHGQIERMKSVQQAA